MRPEGLRFSGAPCRPLLASAKFAQARTRPGSDSRARGLLAHRCDHHQLSKSHVSETLGLAAPHGPTHIQTTWPGVGVSVFIFWSGGSRNLARRFFFSLQIAFFCLTRGAQCETSSTR